MGKEGWLKRNLFNPGRFTLPQKYHKEQKAIILAVAYGEAKCFIAITPDITLALMGKKTAALIVPDFFKTAFRL